MYYDYQGRDSSDTYSLDPLLWASLMHFRVGSSYLSSLYPPETQIIKYHVRMFHILACSPYSGPTRLDTPSLVT